MVDDFNIGDYIKNKENNIICKIIGNAYSMGNSAWELGVIGGARFALVGSKYLEQKRRVRVEFVMTNMKAMRVLYD